MTREQAKRILHEAGESYTGAASLSGIRRRTGDPVILKACDRLSADLLAIAKRRPLPACMWVELGTYGVNVRIEAGHAAQGGGDL